MLLVVALLLLVAMASATAIDGRSTGGLIAHRLGCSLRLSCSHDDGGLEARYGPSDAALVRRHLPGLMYEPGERQVPVDWRECRDIGCATASDDRDLDVHRSETGHRVTVFTHLVREGSRRYIQYWFYYPDSNSTFAHSDRIWRYSPLLRLGGLVLNGTASYPGYHRDDWEAASVRVAPDREPAIRVTSHGHWQWCKRSSCRGRWGPSRGWARVSRGSHAGHIAVEGDRIQVPGPKVHERTTTPDGVRLVPLEGVDRDTYRRLDPDIAPPWRKAVWADPRSPES